MESTLGLMDTLGLADGALGLGLGAEFPVSSAPSEVKAFFGPDHPASPRAETGEC